MKKGLIFLVLLILAIGIAGSLTYTISNRITVNASIFDVSGQLTNLESWKKWDIMMFDKADHITIINDSTTRQSRVVTTDGKTLVKLTVINPAMLFLEQGTGKDSQLITINPAKKDGSTNVEWIAKSTGFQWLKNKITGAGLVNDELNSLKKFTESATGLYGFPIQRGKVMDALICTKKAIVPTAQVKQSTGQLLTVLRRLMKANNLPAASNYYYVSSSALLGGNSELAVGIPVKSELRSGTGLEFLKFPADGYLLTGTYDGPASGIQRIYNAMDKYVRDKRLSKVAQSMEKYTDDPAALAQKSYISMQLIYPVY